MPNPKKPAVAKQFRSSCENPESRVAKPRRKRSLSEARLSVKTNPSKTIARAKPKIKSKSKQKTKRSTGTKARRFSCSDLQTDLSKDFLSGYKSKGQGKGRRRNLVLVRSKRASCDKALEDCKARDLEEEPREAPPASPQLKLSQIKRVATDYEESFSAAFKSLSMGEAEELLEKCMKSALLRKQRRLQQLQSEQGEAQERMRRTAEAENEQQLRMIGSARRHIKVGLAYLHSLTPLIETAPEPSERSVVVKDEIVDSLAAETESFLLADACLDLRLVLDRASARRQQAYRQQEAEVAVLVYGQGRRFAEALGSRRRIGEGLLHIRSQVVNSLASLQIDSQQLLLYADRLTEYLGEGVSRGRLALSLHELCKPVEHPPVESWEQNQLLKELGDELLRGLVGEALSWPR